MRRNLFIQKAYSNSVNLNNNFIIMNTTMDRNKIVFHIKQNSYCFIFILIKTY